jgi:TetR/AcrR family transcriptional repressor of mexJK operon
LGAQLADQILDAAQHLFLDQGFETTTVEEIAARIGATKRTIYVRFADKAQLFRAVVTRVLDARRPRLSTIGTDRTVDERLTDMGLALLLCAGSGCRSCIAGRDGGGIPLPGTQPDD